MRRIYLDYATTTPLDKKVERVMKPYHRGVFGNPESLHAEGVAATRALTEFRTNVARQLEAHTDEIIFTSGGTESNNISIQGVIRGHQKKGKDIHKLHAVTSVIEHSSVLETFRSLERDGLQVTYVSVSGEGIVDLNKLKVALRAETVLVSVMHANNEIGTIQPVRKISKIIRDFTAGLDEKSTKPIFHVDACQSALYLPVDQNRLGADLISLDAHKMFGPKGVGALYVRRGTPCASIMYGGGQEKGFRPGTVPLSLIAGFAEALSLAARRREIVAPRVTTLRDDFLKRLKNIFPDVIINGSVIERLPHNINVSMPGLNAEFAVMQLDALGVACSTKSACLEKERESYVVKALGRDDGGERSALRFTLGPNTTKRDIDTTLRFLVEVARRQGIEAHKT